MLLLYLGSCFNSRHFPILCKGGLEGWFWIYLKTWPSSSDTIFWVENHIWKSLSLYQTNKEILSKDSSWVHRYCLIWFLHRTQCGLKTNVRWSTGSERKQCRPAFVQIGFTVWGFLLPSLSGLQGFFWSRFSECILDRTQSVLCVHRADYIKCDKDLVPGLLGQHSWQKPKDSAL